MDQERQMHGSKARVGPFQRPPNRPETRAHNCYGNRPKGRKLPIAKMAHATSSKKSITQCARNTPNSIGGRGRRLVLKKFENVGCILPPKAEIQQKLIRSLSKYYSALQKQPTEVSPGCDSFSVNPAPDPKGPPPQQPQP